MAKSAKERLEELFDREVDRRFETEILDRLRGKRLSPLAAKPEEAVETATQEESGMSDDDLAMLQLLDQGDDNNAAA